MPNALAGAPLPFENNLVRLRRPGFKPGEDPFEGKIEQVWLEYMSKAVQAIDQSPARLNRVSLTGQTASISATDFSGGAIQAGRYRVSYYARITTPAGTSSSLTVTIGWTDGGVACTQAGAAMTGNLTTTQQNGSLYLLVDGASPITYSTTYASVGAPAMQYKLEVLLEELAA